MEERTVLVAVDFSACSKTALRKAFELLGGMNGRIVALHVIDHHFVKECVRHGLGHEGQIKKELFLEAKEKLRRFLLREKLNGARAAMEVREGVPFVEINRRAVELHADLVVLGSCGKASDMDTMFFGSTAEKVLRFITRPVLCVPPETEYRMNS